MPVFGRFETVEELASSGPFAVFSAREAGGSAPAFAVKIYRTADMFADAEVVEREAAVFLEVVALQKGLPAGPAAGGGGHWAPIHESGRTAEAVYYVTDLFPASLLRMVDSRRELDGRAIAHLIGGVVDGLDELARAAGGRGHGALQPSNVLIGSGDVASAQVSLTDPESAQRLDSHAPAQDLRAVAGLLFQLIVHRQPPKGGAITTSPEWQSRGSGGELLRQLCESLLNPQAGTPLMTFDEIRARLKAVEAERAPSKGGLPLGAKLGAAGVLVAALALGAFFYLQQPKGPPPDPRPTGWMVQETSQIEQRLKTTTTRARDNADEAGVAKMEKFAADYAAFMERLEVARQVPPPQTPAEANAIDNRKTDTERSLAELDKQLSQIDQSIEVIDPGTDPRKEGWMDAQTAALDTLLGAVVSVMPTEGAANADIAALQGEVQQFKDRVAQVKAMAWTRPDATPAELQEHQAQVTRSFRETNASLPTVQTSLKQAKVKARDRLKEYFDEHRRPQDITSPTLLEAFITAARTIDPERDETLDWAAVKGRFDALRSWVSSADAAFSDTLEVQLPAGSDVSPEVAQRAVRDRREQFLRAVAAPVIKSGQLPAPGGDAFSAERGQFNAYVAQVRGVLQDAAEVERLLSQGYAYSENHDGKSIASLETAITQAPATADIQPAVTGVLRRCRDLASVATITERPRLVTLVAAAPDAPGALSPARAAWEKLEASQYPGDAAELRQAGELYSKGLAPAFDAMADRARGSTLKADAQSRLKKMWAAFVREKTGGDAAAIDAAYSTAPALGITAAELGALDPWARHNLERWKFLKTLRGVNETDRKKQIVELQRLVLGFKQDTSSIDVSSRPDVQALWKRLKTFEDAKDLNLAEEGPGRAGWKFRAGDDEGGVAFYTWQAKDGTPYSLEFRRVSENPDFASYLCTTEMPAGLCIDLVDSADAWTVFRGQVNATTNSSSGFAIFTNPSNDSRSGPRVTAWTAANRGAKLIISPPTEPDKTGMGWHRAQPTNEMATLRYYPEGGEPSRGPAADHPIEYLPVTAYVFLARTLGCRLPTSQEWAAAVAAFPATSPNLRDTSYAAQYVHIHGIEAAANRNVDYPASGMYRGPNTANVPGPSNDPATATTVDDGFLYFAGVAEEPAGARAVFHHLVGNVWEFVFEEPAPMEALPLSPTLKDVNKLLARGEQLRLIGGSAVSSPLLAINQPLEIPMLKAREGCSDVGFRLAFSTGGGSGGTGAPVDRLAKILSESYLGPTPR